MQVCQAIHFAHSKGILHLDLKPENIMLGPFGEVYVLDWGISVTTQENEALPIPRASQISSLAGTPSYMAPEQVMILPEKISEKTDIYQLGAILHECMTGRSKHIGDSLMQVLFQATRSEPYPYGPDVPEELAEIANRATHVNPDKRFESVEAFRQAIVFFLQHRESIAMAHEAQKQQERFTELCQGEDLQKKEKIIEIHSLFSEARFAYQQALRIWEDNENASQGLKQLHVQMVEVQISTKDVEAASLYYAQIQEPPEKLTQALQQLQQEQADKEQEIQALQALKKDVDFQEGKSARDLIDGSFGLLFGILLLFFSESVGGYEFTYDVYLAILVVGGVCTFGITLVWGKLVTSTVMNRSVIITSWLILIVMSLHFLSIKLRGLPPDIAFNDVYLFILIIVGIYGSAFDTRLLLPLPCLILAYVFGLFWPKYIIDIAALISFSSFIVIVLLWWQEEPQQKAPPTSS